MKSGDKVNWRREWSGGYRWTRVFPAVVVKINPRTVRIRVGRWERGKPLIAVERNVRPESLTARVDDCEHEALLAVTRPGLATAGESHPEL